MQVLRSLTSKDMIHHQTGCSQPSYIHGGTSFAVEQSLLTEIFLQQLFLFFGTLLQEWSEVAMENLMQEILEQYLNCCINNVGDMKLYGYLKIQKKKR